MVKKKGIIDIEHQGDHHYAKIAVDPKSKKVSAGAIAIFQRTQAQCFV